MTIHQRRFAAFVIYALVAGAAVVIADSLIASRQHRYIANAIIIVICLAGVTCYNFMFQGRSQHGAH